MKQCCMKSCFINLLDLVINDCLIVSLARKREINNNKNKLINSKRH